MRMRAVYSRRWAINWPEQARDPAPNEKCWIPWLGFSSGGSEVESGFESQRSGSNVAAEGPKWSISSQEYQK